MENSFRFYRNDSCMYFPCHSVENEEDFNCMFCYCPLYLMEECGGNYRMSYGVKDCSNCLIPHKPQGYDHINRILTAEIEKRAEEYFKEEE